MTATIMMMIGILLNLGVVTFITSNKHFRGSVRSITTILYFWAVFVPYSLVIWVLFGVILGLIQWFFEWWFE